MDYFNLSIMCKISKVYFVVPLLLYILSCKGTNSFSSQTYWTEILGSTFEANLLPSKYKAYNLDFDKLKLKAESNNAIEIPTPTGEMLVVDVKISSTMSPSLAKKYPEIRSYEVLTSGKITSGRIDINSSGFYAMMIIDSETYFINPVESGNIEYVCYLKSDANTNSKNPFFEKN